MGHELTKTVERDGKHFVIDTVGSNAGDILGPTNGFKTEELANMYADSRSKSFNPLTRVKGKSRTKQFGRRHFIEPSNLE